MIGRDSWWRHGFVDSGLVEVSARVQILENGDLLLADSRETDAGKYTCIRANEAGSVQGSAHLAILGEFKNYLYFLRIFPGFFRYFS